MKINQDTLLKDVVFTVFDTETTGDNKNREDKPIEISVVHWNMEKGFLNKPTSWLVNPEIPIHPAAIAVHGLTDEDVENSPRLPEIIPQLHEYVKDTVLIAHNISFDLDMLPSLNELSNEKIDTLRFVKHIFKIGDLGLKDQPLSSHKMQELRYWLDLKVDTMGLPAHRAAADILVTGEVFAKAMTLFIERTNSQTLGDMVKFINSPILIEKMPMGKFKGVPITEVIEQEKNNPKNYIRWLLGEMNKKPEEADVDLKYSIEHYMNAKNLIPTEQVEMFSSVMKKNKLR